MTEAELVTLVTAGGTAIAAGARWALRLWATVRREAISAQQAAAAQASLDHQRMVEALIGQARSMAELGGKIDALAIKLETIADWRERTPLGGYAAVEPEDDTRRQRPHGYRPPARGGHND